ncbi:MAG: M23 family metallopeptidase, partial [Cryobacterium sp.]|nr:M23 family metallopeptidase [Cryobacterium sp.]
QVSIKAPAGYTVSYLHMKLSDVSVRVGDTVAAGQPIALVGSEGPSTGCHLDLRININGTTDVHVAGLTQSQTLGGPVSGFVDPEEFYALFGSTLCDDTCNRGYDE